MYEVVAKKVQKLVPSDHVVELNHFCNNAHKVTGLDPNLIQDSIMHSSNEDIIVHVSKNGQIWLKANK